MNKLNDEISRFYEAMPYPRYLRSHLWEVTRAWATYNAGYQDEFSGELPDLWEDMLLLHGGRFLPWYAQLEEGYSAEWLKGFHVHHASYENKSWEKRKELIMLTSGLHQDLHEHPKIKGEVNNFALHKRTWLANVDPNTGIPFGETRIPGGVRRKAFELDAVAVQLETKQRREIHTFIATSPH